MSPEGEKDADAILKKSVYKCINDIYNNSDDNDKNNNNNKVITCIRWMHQFPDQRNAESSVIGLRIVRLGEFK